MQILEQLLTDHIHRRRQAQTHSIVAHTLDHKQLLSQQLQQGNQGWRLRPAEYGQHDGTCQGYITVSRALQTRATISQCRPCLACGCGRQLPRTQPANRWHISVHTGGFLTVNKAGCIYLAVLLPDVRADDSPLLLDFMRPQYSQSSSRTFYRTSLLNPGQSCRREGSRVAALGVAWPDYLELLLNSVLGALLCAGHAA